MNRRHDQRGKKGLARALFGKWVEKLGDSRLAQLAGFLLLAGAMVLNQYAQDYVRHDWMGGHPPLDEATIQHNAVRDRNIHDKLVELRTVLDADRATVFLLHNGEYWNHGEPVTKLSAVYESTRDGVSSEIDHMQNIRLSRIPEVVAFMGSEQQPRSIDVPDLDAGFWRSMLASQGVAHSVKVPLRVDGTIAGMLTVGYNRSAEETIDTWSIADAATRIEFMLGQQVSPH